MEKNRKSFKRRPLIENIGPAGGDLEDWQGGTC